MPISPGNILLARFVWNVGDRYIYITRHYRAATTLGDKPHSVAAQKLADTHAVLFAQCMSGLPAQLGTYVHTIWPAGDTDFGVGVYTASVTPYGPNSLPLSVCAIARLPILVPRPRRNGRVYIPSVPTSALDSDGSMLSTYKTAVQGFLATLGNNVTVTGLPGSLVMVPIVWHRDDLSFDRFNPPVVERRWGTQRRRGDFETPTPAPYRSLD